MEFVTSQGVLTEEIIPILANALNIALDIETRGKDFRESPILCVQLNDGQNIWVLDARSLDLQPLFDLLEQTNPLISGHNLKYDLSFLRRDYNYHPARIFDTMLAYGILHNGIESPYISLQNLLFERLHILIDKDKRETFSYTYGELTEEQLEYAATDVKYLPQIVELQTTDLTSSNMIEVAKLEFSLIPVVLDIEAAGVRIDVEKWEGAVHRLAKETSELELEIGKIIGGGVTQGSFFDLPESSINPRSTQQMKAAFRRFGFPVDSTAETTISKIDHPLARTLLEYRTSHKLLTTYGMNFLSHVKEDGKVYANFDQAGARSGRFSSSKPNLQNIPASKFYRDCFIADDDCMLITADWRQIELKTAATLSGESLMIDEYNKKDADLHRLTATKIYGVVAEEVISTQRDTAKNCNFSILYDISKYGLRRRYGIPLNEGEFLIASFWKAYPTLAKYMNHQADVGISRGYTTTKLGRRRYAKMPPINSSTYYREIAKIRRELANHPVQGTAGDILKLALVNLNKALKPYNATIINIVHDEIVVQSPTNCVSHVIPIVTTEMENAGTTILGDVLRWDISLAIGRSWRKS